MAGIRCSFCGVEYPANLMGFRWYGGIWDSDPDEAYCRDCRLWGKADETPATRAAARPRVAARYDAYYADFWDRE